VVIVAPTRDSLLRAIPLIKELRICVNLTNAAPPLQFDEIDLMHVSSGPYQSKGTTLSLKDKRLSFLKTSRRTVSRKTTMQIKRPQKSI
jgi:hypothetical protein